MQWRRPPAEDAPAEPSGSAQQNAAPAPATRKFSAPPAAPVPPAMPSTKYENIDFSKYGSNVHESDGLQDAHYARRSSSQGQWIQNPRVLQCVNNIQLGAKMGATVGGCFGLLTGAWVAVTQRNLLVLPVSVVGGAISFGFFLGCGMIIRCEENPTVPALSNWIQSLMPKPQCPASRDRSFHSDPTPRLQGYCSHLKLNDAVLFSRPHVKLEANSQMPAVLVYVSMVQTSAQRRQKYRRREDPLEQSNNLGYIWYWNWTKM